MIVLRMMNLISKRKVNQSINQLVDQHQISELIYGTQQLGLQSIMRGTRGIKDLFCEECKGKVEPATCMARTSWTVRLV